MPKTRLTGREMVERASEAAREDCRVIIVASEEQRAVVLASTNAGLYDWRSAIEQLTAQDWEQADVILDANAWRFVKHRYDGELVELERPDESGAVLVSHDKPRLVGGKPCAVEKTKAEPKRELRPWAKIAVAAMTTAIVFIACAVAFGALAFAVHLGWILGWRLAQ